MDDLGNRAEDASIAASLGAQQLPVKLEGRCREVEHELNRTVQVNVVSSFDKFKQSRVISHKFTEITLLFVAIQIFSDDC